MQKYNLLIQLMHCYFNSYLTSFFSTSDASDKSCKRQKRKATDDLWKSGKRKVGMDDSELMESSSCDSTSRSTPLPQEIETSTPNSALGFQTDLELSGLDPSELLSDKASADFNNLGDVEDIEDVHSREGIGVEISPTNLSIELCDKNLVPPIISITPVPSSPSEFSVNSNKDKRAGSSSVTVPSTVTITPITSSSSKSSEERSKDRKSSRSSKDEKNRLEKKRRRKRDESPMGPPEKIPAKQDPLTKPVTVSIKPTESPPLTPTSTPTSPSMMGKYSPSPTQNRPLSSISGKLSPNLTKSSTKISSQHSPKHSPAHVPSSPKHTITGISSPKHHGTSPKHASSGSGKPSMSTLKSAANSPSNKSSSSSDSKSKSSSKDGSRDKDKKLSSNMFSVSNKNKSSSLKVKPLDINTNEVASDGLPSPSGSNDPSKANHVRSRKGSLSAIVDKLKVNAQSCDTPTDLSTKSSSSSKDRTNTSTNKSNELTKSSAKLSGEAKNSEYMVKPSSDGMKITINKTRSKDSSSSKSSSNSTGTSKGKYMYIFFFKIQSIHILENQGKKKDEYLENKLILFQCSVKYNRKLLVSNTKDYTIST